MKSSFILLEQVSAAEVQENYFVTNQPQKFEAELRWV